MENVGSEKAFEYMEHLEKRKNKNNSGNLVAVNM